MSRGPRFNDLENSEIKVSYNDVPTFQEKKLKLYVAHASPLFRVGPECLGFGPMPN